jgi:hypothetical protein
MINSNARYDSRTLWAVTSSQMERKNAQLLSSWRIDLADEGGKKEKTTALCCGR